MADRSSAVPQSDDANLVATIVRTLRIIGPLGRFNVLDTIVPTFNMGDAVTRTVQVREMLYNASSFFSNGTQTAQPANTVHADTGQLAAGDYDIIVTAQNQVASEWGVEHRNAANLASLMAMPLQVAVRTTVLVKFAYTFALDERLRVLNRVAFGAGQQSAAWIFAVQRT